MTTQEDIRVWFKKGITDGNTHMIVVHDSHEDYPVFVKTDDATKVSSSTRAAYAQQVEVYDLNMDMEMQLANSARAGATIAAKRLAAERIAKRDYEAIQSIEYICRLIGDDEGRPNEPIKMLEVDSETIPSGMQPLCFGHCQEEGINYPPCIIISVTPEEFDHIEDGSMILPNGWRREQSYSRPS